MFMCVFCARLFMGVGWGEIRGIRPPPPRRTKVQNLRRNPVVMVFLSVLRLRLCRKIANISLRPTILLFRRIGVSRGRGANAPPLKIFWCCPGERRKFGVPHILYRYYAPDV